MLLSNGDSLRIIAIGLFIFLLGYIILFDKALMNAGYILISFGNFNLFYHLNTIRSKLLIFLSIICIFNNLFIFGILIQIGTFIIIFKEKIGEQYNKFKRIFSFII